MDEKPNTKTSTLIEFIETEVVREFVEVMGYNEEDFEETDLIHVTMFYTHRMTKQGWTLEQLREVKWDADTWKQVLNWGEGYSA